ncbi:MAG: HEAT repeat domain-containing protein [Nanoarchaeota archaeon]|nr:HEAT repeat domain-containing protein [Nanoarchaeota archaeon]
MLEHKVEKMEKNRDIDGLIKALKDSNWKVRWDAANALGRLGDKRAVEPLIKVLKDTDPNMRVWAAMGLGNIGDERAVKPLINALKDSNTGVRVRASEALERIGEPAFEPLINALKDNSGDVRGWAAWTLGKIGDTKALDALEKLKNDTTTVKWGSRSKALNAIAEEAVTKIKSGNAYKERIEQGKEPIPPSPKPEAEQVVTVNKDTLEKSIDDMQKNIPNIFVDDIKTHLLKGDFNKAEQLLNERKRNYERYLELVRNLKDIEEEATMLSRRLAKGELPADAYERAREDLEDEKKSITEESYNLQRKIFIEKEPKPF